MRGPEEMESFASNKEDEPRYQSIMKCNGSLPQNYTGLNLIKSKKIKGF
jgi:hypothetical protein